MWDECNCVVIWTFSSVHGILQRKELPFFGIGMKIDLFQGCGHCWVFQICWHIGCSTLAASPKVRGKKCIFRLCIMSTLQIKCSSVGTPLQYSCLENPMDGGAWWAAVHVVTNSWTRLKWLHFHLSLSCIGEGNGNALQCSCLENPRDGRAWWAAVYGVAQGRTRLKRLSSSSSSGGNGLVAKLCLTLCDPSDCSLSVSSVHGIFPGKNTGVGCLFLLQGIFPTQALNPHFLCCRWRSAFQADSWLLSHQGSP